MPTQTSTRHSEVKSTPILSADGAFFFLFFSQNWTKYSWIRLVSMAACSEIGATLRQHMFTSSLDEKKDAFSVDHRNALK